MIRVLVALFIASCAFAQDLALERLKQELKIIREQDDQDAREASVVLAKTGDWPEDERKRSAARIEHVQTALRDWIESRLSNGPNAAAISSSAWQSSTERELADAGIGLLKEDDPNSGPLPFTGVHVRLSSRPELPNLLLVVAGVAVGCGEDEAFYAYRFDANGRARVIADHASTSFGYGDTEIDVSDVDSVGRRLLVVHRRSVQCASAWMQTAYSVFRISLDSTTTPVPLLSSEHDFWMGNEDDGLLFALKPDELIVEFLDRSIDGGVHNRTQLHRFSFVDGAKRIEPVALQPQDFAEEWIAQPWSEVQKMSAPQTQKWHAAFPKGMIFGEYQNIVPCSKKPDRWSVGFEITDVDGKALPKPMDLHLMVRDLGNYRYSMEAVSDSPFKECPGEGQPSQDHPWLSKEQLKALP